jgi:hypothetical protein
LAFRIHRSTNAEAIVFALSGAMEIKHIEHIKGLLEAEKQRPILLDLRDVTLVGRDAVEFLSRLEAAGVGIVNCPDYVRTWIEAENRGER